MSHQLKKNALYCPSCSSLLVIDGDKSLQCTRCNWRLISLAEWEKRIPFTQGLIHYLQSAWPTSELAKIENPYDRVSKAWEEFRRGERAAVLMTQDVA